jgi:hypothetical protein
MSNLDTNETPACAPSAWNAPKPDVLAKPTWWPAALAFGITLIAWGLITSAIVLAMGLVVVIVSLAGWIGDICHERKQR